MERDTRADTTHNHSSVASPSSEPDSDSFPDGFDHPRSLDSARQAIYEDLSPFSNCTDIRPVAVEAGALEAMGNLGLEAPNRLVSSLETSPKPLPLTLGWDDDATVKCWGSNDYGQLGQGSNTPIIEPRDFGDNLSPVSLGTGRTALAVSAGDKHTCVLLDNGDVKCWGSNENGQVGLEGIARRGSEAGEMGDSLAIVNLGTGRTALALSVGSEHTCVLLDNESVKCWGNGGLGKLGQGNDHSIGAEIGSMGDWLLPVDLGNASTLASCYLGSYLGASGCVPCPSGTWAPMGARREVECVPCAAGKFGASVGATACSLCPAGRYFNSTGATGSDICDECGLGKYSEAEGAINEGTCRSCDAGTYADLTGAAVCKSCAPGSHAHKEGLVTCEPCSAGRFSNTWGIDQCETCPAGKYSSVTLDDCVSCASGLASAEGSSSASDCQSTTTSFVAGGVLLGVTLVVMAIYVCFGRARRVAFLEQQTSTPILVQACTAASAVILTRIQRERTTRFLWKMCLVLVTFVALFVATMIWFITNTFLLSTSFFSPPDWMERFEDAMSDFIEAFPLFWFLIIFPPIMRWIRDIDFTFLMAGVRVTCLGAQGPALLFGTAVIVVATVLVVDSQFHAMLALAFVPMTSLVQMELISATAPSWHAKAGNMLKFAVLVVASAMMMSCSRYVMQVFTTLVEYSSFLPYREFSPACNDDGVDSALATISTVVFYACIIPVALLMVRVLMPGLPSSIQFQLPEAAIKLAKTGQYRRAKGVLDWFNPLKWAMRGLYRMMLRLVAMSSAGAADIAADFAPTLRHRMQKIERDEVKRRWRALRREELPDFIELLRLLQVQGLEHMRENLWKVLYVCAWKLKLAMLVVLGVWTDEVATAMQIDAIALQYYGWTQDPKLLHEDVMGVIGSMRSMTWMLLPPLIVLTKMAEVTNNPPVFVFTDKLHMTSPLLFWSWPEAETVMLEGKVLLDAIHDRTEKMGVGREKSMHTSQGQNVGEDFSDWESRLQHNLRVALVWVLGARVPRYAVQMSLLLLVVSMAIDPRMETLILAACIILLWSLVYAVATLLDVRLMLRLRKEQPGAQSGDGAMESHAEIEMPTVAPEAVVLDDAGITGDVDESDTNLHLGKDSVGV